jgi:hypothetical protein
MAAFFFNIQRLMSFRYNTAGDLVADDLSSFVFVLDFVGES